METAKLTDFPNLPNGTLLQYRNCCYVLQHGLEGRIVTDVDTGYWRFVKELEWKTVRVLFKPDRPLTTQE
jgi:hypothetical protein